MCAHITYMRLSAISLTRYPLCSCCSQQLPVLPSVDEETEAQGEGARTQLTVLMSCAWAKVASHTPESLLPPAACWTEPSLWDSKLPEDKGQGCPILYPERLALSRNSATTAYADTCQDPHPLLSFAFWSSLNYPVLSPSPGPLRCLSPTGNYCCLCPPFLC